MERAAEVPKQATPSAVSHSNNAENGEMPSDVATMATSVASGSVVMMTAEVVLSGPSGQVLAAKTVKEFFYVDDDLPSVETKQEALTLFHLLQELFNRGGFKLHMWDSNSPEVLNSIPSEIRSTKTLSTSETQTTSSKPLGWSTAQVKVTSDSLLLIRFRKNLLLPSVQCSLIQRKSLTPLVSSPVSPS